MELTLQHKNKTHKQLLWIGIGSIVMFFAGLTSAYVVRKAEGNWLEFIMPTWFSISFLTIIVSSIFLWFAIRKVKNGGSATNILLVILALGLFFSYAQMEGWKELIAQGVYLTGEGSNPSGSFIYVITLAHLLHLVGGIIALLITTIKSKLGKYTSEDYLGMELTSNYWHFLGLLWVYLFLFFKFI